VKSVAEARKLLGLGADAGADDVRAARRRLAKNVHPDAGGDDRAMRELNEAADMVLDELDRPAPPGAASVAADPVPPAPPGAMGTAPPTGPGRVDHDVASFTIEALPVVAFEALLVVTSWIGEVVVDEPPYQLDVVLTDPLRCWCRLGLVPDAGASTVALTIASLPGEPLPPIDSVRDLWVASLNQLGADPDGEG
jgi:hypothetical protein